VGSTLIGTQQAVCKCKLYPGENHTIILVKRYPTRYEMNFEVAR